MSTDHHIHEHGHDHNVFTLFVSHSNRDFAVNQVVKALSVGCFCPFQLVVLDVEKEASVAAEENIEHTPALVRERPGPRRILCGDLSQCEEVRAFLHCSH